MISCELCAREWEIEGLLECPSCGVKYKENKMSEKSNVVVGEFNNSLINYEPVAEFEQELIDAIERAQDRKIPQGFIVALLQAYLMIETQNMMGDE